MIDEELSPAAYLTPDLGRAGQPRLAYRHRAGTGPLLVFLPGYMSDMQGSKAIALDNWAAAQGRAMLRLDYAGCGESEGDFAQGTLASWRDDARAIIDAVAPDAPLILIGSSMGGWIALLLARDLGPRVTGLVGIAAAPDFTQWGFSEDQKAIIRQEGKLVEKTPYGDEPSVIMCGFWESGQSLLLLESESEIAIDGPVRLLQGQQDADVPWQTALQIAERLRSADVQTSLVKDGDHRLSRPQDIALLIATVASLTE
jgi:pimeloyl-ACP methyl ester carboxylesterase